MKAVFPNISSLIAGFIRYWCGSKNEKSKWCMSFMVWHKFWYYNNVYHCKYVIGDHIIQLVIKYFIYIFIVSKYVVFQYHNIVLMRIVISKVINSHNTVRSKYQCHIFLAIMRYFLQLYTWRISYVIIQP